MLPDFSSRSDVPAAPAAPGEIIGGKYRVGQCIGFGGMGVVCAATHLELERKIAIKFVRPDLAESGEFVARFLNEARAAAALRSEHVAQVLDCGRLPSGIPYMVLEYLEGADLETIVGTRGPLPIDQAVDFGLQLCEALAEAHAAHIIHRDIKPQNLFVTEGPGGTPTLKVLDFGVSKRLTSADPSVTQTSHGVGSPHYMSPEQMTSPSEVDGRTDIWSVGAVLFELLAGRPPFTGETLPEICAKVVTQPAPYVRAFRPNLPPRLEAVVQRCLEKNREQRFADVGELAEALTPFASNAGRASADLVLRILGRDPALRRTATVAVIDDDLPRGRRGREAIPGVRRSGVPLLFAILALGGAILFGAERLIRGGVEPSAASSAEPVLADAGVVAVSPTLVPKLQASAPTKSGGASAPTLGTSTRPRTPAVADPASAHTSRAHAPHGRADAGAAEEINPRDVPKNDNDPRDVDPPGIGNMPILAEPPDMSPSPPPER